MIDRNLQRLKYQTSVHHRQNLRKELDQSLIDQIQISPTPSQNYQKAYQSLYQDELQKSIILHDQKKNIEQTKKIYDTLVAGKHVKLYRDDQPFKNSISAINIPNLNYRDVSYVDYDLHKETKALDHTLKNYDGGQGFFKYHDLHLLNKQNQLQNMRMTLQKQLNAKQQQKYNEYVKHKQQQYALKNRQQIENMHQSQLQRQAQDQRSKHRDEILNQMQEERIKRARRSIFNYNSIARHNPITNPIEYHIDNPYILKQIQNKERIRQ